MKFMALTYTDPALTPSMGEKMNETCFALNRRRKEAGVKVARLIFRPVGLKIDNATLPLRYLGNLPRLLAVGALPAVLARIATGYRL